MIHVGCFDIGSGLRELDYKFVTYRVIRFVFYGFEPLGENVKVEVAFTNEDRKIEYVQLENVILFENPDTCILEYVCECNLETELTNSTVFHYRITLLSNDSIHPPFIRGIRLEPPPRLSLR